jgi:hypothetical protein
MTKATLFNTMRAFRRWLPHSRHDEPPDLTMMLPEGDVWELSNEDGSFFSKEDEQRFRLVYELASRIPTSPPAHLQDTELLRRQHSTT